MVEMSKRPAERMHPVDGRRRQIERRRRTVAVLSPFAGIALVLVIVYSSFLLWLVIAVVVCMGNFVGIFLTGDNDRAEGWCLGLAIGSLLVGMVIGIVWGFMADHSFTVGCHNAGGRTYTFDSDGNAINYCTVDF